MPKTTRYKNVMWLVADGVSTDAAQLAVLMDIRDQLRVANRSLLRLLKAQNPSGKAKRS